MQISLAISLTSLLFHGGATAQTALQREPNGSVTVVSIGPAWTPTLTRQGDGTVTVGAA